MYDVQSTYTQFVPLAVLQAHVYSSCVFLLGRSSLRDPGGIPVGRVIFFFDAHGSYISCVDRRSDRVRFVTFPFRRICGLFGAACFSLHPVLFPDVRVYILRLLLSFGIRFCRLAFTQSVSVYRRLLSGTSVLVQPATAFRFGHISRSGSIGVLRTLHCDLCHRLSYDLAVFGFIDLEQEERFA